QAQILDLLADLQQRLGMAVLIITHDLGVIAEVADDVMVMYAGKIVESAPVAALFADPQHPYTIGLLGSIPRLDVDRERLSTIEGTVPSPNNQPKGCRFSPRCPFPVTRGLIRRKVIGMVRAVEGVTFDIARGETLALVGESGCGKSTTGRLVLRLMDPTAGSVRFKGEEIAGLDKQTLRRMRRHMQIIFQDPYASLNPRMTVGEILAEPLNVHEIGDPPSRVARVRELLEVVGLLPEQTSRYPHQF